jgi:hypothetical protein
MLTERILEAYKCIVLSLIAALLAVLVWHTPVIRIVGDVDVSNTVDVE